MSHGNTGVGTEVLSWAGRGGFSTTLDHLVLQTHSLSSRPLGQMCSRTEILEMRSTEYHTCSKLHLSFPQWGPGLPENQTQITLQQDAEATDGPTSVLCW